jgi:hypothetical protein
LLLFDDTRTSSPQVNNLFAAIIGDRSRQRIGHRKKKTMIGKEVVSSRLTERWVQWAPWILGVDVSPNSGVLPNETKKQMLDERTASSPKQVRHSSYL